MIELMRADGRRIALTTVLQCADIDGVTGQVVLPAGRIELFEGQIVGAQHGPWADRDALFELMLDSAPGLMVMTDEAPSAEAPIARVSSLLLEGTRRADEWSLHAERVFEVVQPASDPATQAVEASLDGTRALFEAVERSDTPRHRAALMAAAALSDGRWRDTGRVRERPRTTEDEPLDTLLERGRQLVRAGRLSAALDTFTQAVRAYPDDRIAQQNLRSVRRRLEQP